MARPGNHLPGPICRECKAEIRQLEALDEAQPSTRIKRLAKIAQAGWKDGVWVGLGYLTAEQIAAGDTTLPQVTGTYSTKAALEAAIADGSAFTTYCAEHDTDLNADGKCPACAAEEDREERRAAASFERP